MDCNLEDINNTFYKRWFSSPNKGPIIFYKAMFVSNRSQIGGTSEKRYFFGEYYSDNCITDYFNSSMVKIMEADKEFTESLNKN